MGHDTLAQAIAQHRPLIWALCYRMSGCPADADDLVQDVAERALRNPPEDLDRELRPWLVRVAMNLSRDHLRKRRRQAYDGPWLPGPASVEAGALAELTTAEARYGELESVTAAFLATLEALTPGQRAVLILRDVLGYSVRETAQALEMGEANVKTTHHRARNSMAAYDGDRSDLSEARLQQHRSALQSLMVHLAARNVDALTALLSQDVTTRNDGGGKYFAARRKVSGRQKVILFHLKVDSLHRRVEAGPPRFAIQVLNGEPAMVAEWPSRDPKVPERMVVRIRIDAEGRIRQLDTVVADRKLRALDFQALPKHPSPAQVGQALRAALRSPPPRSWLGAAVDRAAAVVRRSLVERLMRRRGRPPRTTR